MKRDKEKQNIPLSPFRKIVLEPGLRDAFICQQIRITGEKSFGNPQIYVDDVTYTNTPCNQTRNTRSLNGTTTTSNGPDSSTRPTLSGHGTGITPTTQGPTQGMFSKVIKITDFQSFHISFWMQSKSISAHGEYD